MSDLDFSEADGNPPVSEARRRASDTVAFLLSMDFDPSRLSLEGQVVYQEWVSESPLNVQGAAMVFGTARLSINAARVAGVTERDIYHEFMGRVHDEADANSVPSRRSTSAPRHELMALTRAIFELAAEFHDDQVWEDLVRQIETHLEQP